MSDVLGDHRVDFAIEQGSPGDRRQFVHDERAAVGQSVLAQGLQKGPVSRAHGIDPDDIRVGVGRAGDDRAGAGGIAMGFDRWQYPQARKSF